MDRLAERHGSASPWPGFQEVDVAAVARGFGCPAQSITTHDQLLRVVDDVIPTLAVRDEPLLLDVAIAPTETFAP
jgi:benzoylformate decarboxylase